MNASTPKSDTDSELAATGVPLWINSNALYRALGEPGKFTPFAYLDQKSDQDLLVLLSEERKTFQGKTIARLQQLLASRNQELRTLRDLYEKLSREYDTLSVKDITPIDMVLYCPSCRTQHVDEPKNCTVHDCHLYGRCYAEANGEPHHCDRWDNPPHRSHECKNCGFVWRPADISTNGVKELETKGKRDHPVFPTKEQKMLERPNFGPALKLYRELMKDEEELDPLERLRFFCSLAMCGQDWLDVEPFFEAVESHGSEGGKV